MGRWDAKRRNSSSNLWLDSNILPQRFIFSLFGLKRNVSVSLALSFRESKKPWIKFSAPIVLRKAIEAQLEDWNIGASYIF